MTMELEGNLSLERAHTRRWVPIVAVIIPVGAIVLLAAWFVRVYVAPATVLIPNPPMIVAEPAAPPASSVRAQTEAPPPPTAMAEPANPPASEQTAAALPMFATLAVVPPSVGSAPPAYADPVQDGSPAPVDHGGRDRKRSNRASRSPVLFRCRGPSRTAVSRCSPVRYHCRGRGRRRSRPPEDIPAVERHGIALMLFHRVAGRDPHRRKTFSLEHRENFLRMRGVAGLDRDVEPRALGRHVEEQPPVIDLEDVGAEPAERRRDLAQAGPDGRRWSGGTTRCGCRVRARAP